jgi:hypothetical protein
LADQIGQEGSLIKSALALTRGMQWHRNNQIKLAIANSIVLHCCQQPARNQMPEMGLPAVLKIENNVTRDSTASESGDCGVEIKLPVRAIGAVKRVGDFPGKRLRTFRAKWRDNPRQLRLALVAKIFM